MEGARPVRAPRGSTLTAKSWQTEAPLRMLCNNLDPEVAERPDDLVVYGGTGRAARALDLRAPLEPAAPTAAVRDVLRASGAGGPGADRFLAPELEAVVGAVADGRVLAAAQSVLAEKLS